MLTVSCAGGLSELCVLSHLTLCFVPRLCVLSHLALCIVSLTLCFVPLLGKNIRKLVIRKTKLLGNHLVNLTTMRRRLEQTIP